MLTKQNKKQEDLWEEDVMPLENLVQEKPKRKHKNHPKKQLTEYGKSLLAFLCSIATSSISFITLIVLDKAFPVFQLFLFANLILSLFGFAVSMINMSEDDDKFSLFKNLSGIKVFYIMMFPVLALLISIPSYIYYTTWPKIFKDIE